MFLRDHNCCASIKCAQQAGTVQALAFHYSNHFQLTAKISRHKFLEDVWHADSDAEARGLRYQIMRSITEEDGNLGDQLTQKEMYSILGATRELVRQLASHDRPFYSLIIGKERLGAWEIKNRLSVVNRMPRLGATNYLL